MNYDNYKTIFFEFAVIYDEDSVDQDNIWHSSKFFSWPDCDKISFSIYLKDWGGNNPHCGSIIKIKKKGILNPRRAIITIISGDYREVKTMENWNDEFSDDFLIDSNSTFLRSSNIVCHIKIDSLDFYDKNSLLAPMGTHAYRYLLSEELSDVIIKVDNEELPAHKIILASSSPVFHRMLNTNMEETNQNCITLREVDIFSIKQVLLFIYTGRIEQDNDVDMLIKLWGCADMYQITNLKTFCEHQLIQNFTTDNIVKILVETDRFDMPLLHQKGRIYIDFNSTRISYRQALQGTSRSKVLDAFFSSRMKMLVDE